MNSATNKSTLSAERLRELLNYSPTTGVFTWRITANNRLKPGSTAGSVRPSGYINLGVCGKLYLAHRLAWLYVHGAWPEAEVDHINRVKGDNRIANLRAATRAQNCQNTTRIITNTSGYKGVSFCNRRARWYARIHHGGRTRFLGYFDDAASAAEAYVAAASFTHTRNAVVS